MISFLANTVLILLGVGLFIFPILLVTKLNLPFPLNGLVLVGLFFSGWFLGNFAVAKMEDRLDEAKARRLDARNLARQAKYWKSIEPMLRSTRSKDDITDHA